MLPNMADTLIEWEQPIQLKTQSKTTVDFVETVTVTVEAIKAVVQPADKTKLKIDSLDWSKEYVLIHKRGEGIVIGQYVEWNGEDFKIIGPNGNYKNYGYIELVGEATNKALLVAT